jgi:two-component system cell cycle sensor histidine kinase/response regulator CckA
MSSSAPSNPQSPFPISTRKAKVALMGLFSLTVLLWLGSRTLLSANFLPHWYCYLGNQRLLWSNVIADLVIGLSYLAISATLVWLVRRAGRDLPYPYFFWAFGVFTVSCGATHFTEVVTVWKPVYWLLAAVKIVTATASAATAVVLIVAADDIVEFVRTAREAAARRGNEQFRTLVNASPMAVVSADLEGKVTTWNPAAERLFGWSAAEIVGKSVPFMPPDRETESNELSETILAGELTRGFETVRLNRAGERISVSISAAHILDENGKVISTMGVIEDISERKRIDLELQEKTDLLSTVTHALNAYLEADDWTTASRQLLAFAIQKTQSECGFLGVVLEGHVLRILAHDGIVWDTKLNRELFEGKLNQFASCGYFEVEHKHNLLGEIILRGETIITNSPQSDPRAGGVPAGHPAMHSLAGVPIFKGKDTVGLIAVANRPGGYTSQQVRHLESMLQATGVLYDNYRQSLKRTALEEEQKHLESQVHQSQKMEVLGRLAGGVAHDFNNMLMVLGGCTELLDRSLSRESSARMYLDQIQRTTEKAAAITKQLLTFSRKQVVEIHPMDLHGSLTESEFMLPRLLGSDIELTFHHDAGKSWILSAPTQIEQVIANLAINARDAMPEGGRLAISTRNATTLPEEGAGSPSLSGNWVVLEVSDTGSGIDEKTRAQMFEPFFTTKPAGKGTGLGLATVYGIVKQSNGHIRVVSAPGKGARFELYFPLVETAVPETQNSSPAETAEDVGGGATILVADDEPALRHAVVEILRASGYKVFEAQTVPDALEIAEQHLGELDVLLTDIVMAVLRGPERARRVTKIHPDIRVVYMSGYAEGFSEAELPANSVFLQKPFRFATLLEQLKLVRRRV